ncbi:MAG: RimK family alpha-L-glutamate ligase [Patescibacteria group bacterium]|jgi:RimK family alpha-L-glutamate ligase
MKIAILHHDLEHQEEYLSTTFKENGFDVTLMDVREISIDDLRGYDTVINRVFASVANRDPASNNKTMMLLKEFEEKGGNAINSYFTTKCDYSKYLSQEIMNNEGILNPESYLVKTQEDIENLREFTEEIGFPIVIKRDMGGRAVEIFKVDTIAESESILKDKINNSTNYSQGYIVQKFIPSILSHDYRISLINGEIISGSTRSLITKNDNEEPWFASVSSGSVIEHLNIIPKEIEDIAIRSTKAIKAVLNEVDIIMGEDGPVIIENNPTPNFTATSKVSQEKKELMTAKLIEMIA